MSNIFKFPDRKQVTKLSVSDIVINVTNDIENAWGKFAINNKLNEYIITCLPSWCSTTVNYLEDLNAISKVEQKINLEPSVSAPGFGGDQQLGWISAFRIEGKVISSPFMATEQYARAFAILLFLKVKRELVTHDQVVTS